MGKTRNRNRSIRARRAYPEKFVCKQCSATFFSRTGADNHEDYNRGHKVVKR